MRSEPSLSAKQPSSEDVAQLIRKAILPKEFPDTIYETYVPYVVASVTFIDGNDLTSKHAKQIGKPQANQPRSWVYSSFETHPDDGNVESVLMA